MMICNFCSNIDVIGQLVVAYDDWTRQQANPAKMVKDERSRDIRRQERRVENVAMTPY